MPVETCAECGFDGDQWSDAEAMDAIGSLGPRWEQATAGLDASDANRRPVAAMWSIAEYADHVREVLFGMRFVLDSAVEHPGIDLGDAPEPVFAPTPRAIDLTAALAGLGHEASALRARLAELPPESWNHIAVVGGSEIDGRWICRHAVHDATHHLEDVARLRSLLL